MNRIDKVPRDQLRAGLLLHVMTPGTAMRWATVEKRGEGYELSCFDLRREVQSVTTVSSLHLAATLAKRFAKEAA